MESVIKIILYYKKKLFVRQKLIITSIFFVLMIAGVFFSPVLSFEGRQFYPIRIPEESRKEVEKPGIKLPPLPSRKSCVSLARRVAASYGSGKLSQFLAHDFPNAHHLLDTFQKISLTAQRTELHVQSLKNVHIEPWRITKKEEKEGTFEYLLRSECVVQMRTRLQYVYSATSNRIVRTFGHGKWHFVFFISESISNDGDKTVHLHHLSPGNGVDMPDGSRGALLYVQSEDLEGTLFEPDIVENILFVP